MLMIRGSELNDFLRCRLRWNWAWVENLESKRQNSKLFFGTLMHKFLEVYYATGDAGAGIESMYVLMNETDTTSMDPVEYQELSQLLGHVITNYDDQYKTDFDEYEVLATELTFAIPLGNGMGYTGTIDLLLGEKANGRIWFSDYKTTSSIEKYDKNSEMDRQISRYWWALQQLAKGKGYVLEGNKWVRPHKSRIWIIAMDPSFKVYGFFYNIILRDYPVPPKVLQSGKLSTDKRQKTTYELYWQALREHGFLVKQDGVEECLPEYEEMVKHLADNPREFFRRTRVVRNQTEIDMAMAEAMATFKDMKRLRSPKAKPGQLYRNITTDCSWDCPFFDVCKASLDGSNVDFLKATLLQPREVI